ncbi:MAG: signal peptidase II [candidate division WOR-3 bacterium]
MKRPIKMNKHFITVFCILFIAAVDVITRHNAQVYFEPDKTFWVIRGVLGLTYRINYGGLLGFGSKWNLFRFFVLLLSFILLFFAFFYYVKLQRYLTLSLRSFFILFVASILGGLPDRIFLGYTRDWIDWFGPGVANIADYCGFAALFLLIIGLILHPEITWKRFKQYNSSSLKEQFGFYLFQKRGTNDKET